MSEPSFSERLLNDVNNDIDKERGIKCIEKYNLTLRIHKLSSMNNLLYPLFHPRVSNSEDTPGNNIITKEQKIEIVNRSLDDETLENMQNGDKIKYFENNMGSLMTAMKEVLEK